MKKFSIIIAIIAVSSAYAIVCGLPEVARTRAPLISERPILPYYFDSEAGNFRIWYHLATENPDSGIDPTDNDDSGYPDWAELAAEYLERTRAKLVDSLGAKPPVPDFGRGGNDRTDVYFVNMRPGLYGMTHADSTLANGTATAFITIDNDFAGFPTYVGRETDALAVTCAHEFFHAIHFAYGTNMTWVWWMEATAVWSEELNFPHINDYLHYLDYFQEYPSKALNDDTPSGRIYGTVLLPLYIAANYGESAIIDIWERVPTAGVFVALANWADSVGITLDTLYGDFAQWNLFVGENSRGWGYADAFSMPEPARISRSSLPTSLPGAGSAVYVDLTGQFGLPPNHTGGGWAELAAIDTVSALINGISPNYPSDTRDTTLNIFRNPDTLVGLWRYDAIVAVIANLDRQHIVPANLGELLIGPVVNAKVDMFHNIENPPFPNPFRYGEESEFLYFPYSLTENSTIALNIWNSAGDLVFHLEDATSKGLHLTREGALAWRPRNMHNQRLATGIYIYRIAVESDEYIGKISIVNP